MSNSIKLFRRNGLTVVNILFRPSAAFKSSFLPRNPTQVKSASSVLYPRRQVAPVTVTSTTLSQIARVQSTISGSDQSWKHHPHAKLWTYERMIAAVLLATIPASVVLENPITDYLLGATLVLHGYWGLHGIFIDYIHGAQLPKIACAALKFFAIVGFFGLCYFNYYDMGLSKAIKRVWAL